MEFWYKHIWKWEIKWREIELGSVGGRRSDLKNVILFLYKGWSVETLNAASRHSAQRRVLSRNQMQRIFEAQWRSKATLIWVTGLIWLFDCYVDWWKDSYHVWGWLRSSPHLKIDPKVLAEHIIFDCRCCHLFLSNFI